MARVLLPADVARDAKRPERPREPRVLVLELDAAISELPRDHYAAEAPDVSGHLPRLAQLRAVVAASGDEAKAAARAWKTDKHASPTLTVQAVLAYVLSDRSEADEVLRLACERLDPPHAVALVLADATNVDAIVEAGARMTRTRGRALVERGPHVLAAFEHRADDAAKIVLGWHEGALRSAAAASSTWERREVTERAGELLDLVVRVGTPDVARYVAKLVGKAGTREEVARYFKRFPELAEDALRPLTKGRGKVRDAAVAMLTGLAPSLPSAAPEGETTSPAETAREAATSEDAGPAILVDPPWRNWKSAGQLVLEHPPTPTFDLPPEATAKHDREAWCTRLPSVPRNAVFSSRAAFPVAHAWLTSRAEREGAEAWLVTFAPIAIYGLLPFALGEPGPSRTRATSALRFVWSRIAPDRGPKVVERWVDDVGGDRATLLTAVTDIVTADARWDSPSSAPSWPSWLAVDALPPVKLASGATLSSGSRRHLVEMMIFAGAGVGGGDLSAEYVGVREVREALDPTSLAALSLFVYEQWTVLGQAARVSWPLGQIALFGGRSAAHELARKVRSLATDREIARALDALAVLARLPDDTSLVHLATLAESAKAPAVRTEARRLLDATAKQRGLSAEALEDVLVPDLGLDDRGELWLDLGPRRVRLSLDARLAVVLRDEQGERLTQMPRPNKADDPQKAATATELFKAVRADAEGAAKSQLRRFERAMCTTRAWTRAVFEERLLAHPVLRSLVAGLVWRATSAETSITFRVAEDRSLAGPDDEAVALPSDATITLPHPLLLTDPERARWGAIFGDYELLQPFPQLSRETFTLSERERAASTLDRLVGRKGEIGNLYALEQRGWDILGSRTTVTGFRRMLASASVELRFAEMVDLGRPKVTPEVTAQSLAVRPIGGEREATFAKLSAIEASELLRDLAFLVPATR